MLEYLYQRLLVDLIKCDTNLNNLPEEKLSVLLRQRANRTEEVNTIEIMRKKLIDEMIETYGCLKSLVLITTFVDDAKKLQLKYRHKKSLTFDIGLLITAANILYSKIEAYYMPDIFYKLYIFLWQLHNGSFDEIEFFQKIESSSVNVKMILGKDIDPILSQKSLIEENVDSTADDMLPIKESVKYRQRDMNEIKKRMRLTYSKEELQTYLFELINRLLTRPTPERMIIVKAMFQAEKLLNQKNPIHIKTSKDQLKLF